MIQRKLNDKISAIVKCSPTVYTFSAAIFTTVTPLTFICILHTPTWFLKALLVYSTVCLIFSIWQWTQIIINKK